MNIRSAMKITDKKKTKGKLIKRVLLAGLNQKGFTLLEVVITSSILVFLMSIIWSSGSIRNSDFSVMVNQEKLRLLVTRAKSLTVNSVFGADVMTCGYGIRIEERRAFIFLDRGPCGRGNNRRYDPGEEVAGSINQLSSDSAVRFVPSTGASAEVVFIPPDPDVVINGNDSIEELSVQIISSEGMNRRVIINKQGLIDLAN